MPNFAKIRRAIRSRLPIPRSWLFRYIYSLGRWGDGESRSGPGSSLASTQNLREQLPAVVARFGIRTMLDAPCGDFFWMNHVPLTLERYIGGDIVPAMIRENQKRYGRADREFTVLDIVKDAIPSVDLIFCRDCLFHFPLKLAEKALQNFRHSGSRFLITTTFTDGVNENVASGYHYHINLEAPPFHFPPPILRIQDSPTEATRHMALWEIASLPRTTK